jgi:hypothetical protein
LKEIGVDIKRFLDAPKVPAQKSQQYVPSFGGMMMPALPSLSQLGVPPSAKVEAALPTRVLDMKYRYGTLSKAQRMLPSD